MTQQFNFLRIYANMGKQAYSDSEKEHLVKRFIEISECFFAQKDLRFDISGEGYGISKGGAYIMHKTLMNKIEQKGYKKLKGFTVAHKKYLPYRTHFYLSSSPKNISYLDAQFFWESTNSVFDDDNATKIIKSLTEFIHINYAYGFMVDETLGFGEWVQHISEYGSIMSFCPDEINEWDEKINDIPSGAYRKLFNFNVFNGEQIKHLDKSISAQKSKLSDGLQIWVVNGK